MIRDMNITSDGGMLAMLYIIWYPMIPSMSMARPDDAIGRVLLISSPSEPIISKTPITYVNSRGKPRLVNAVSATSLTLPSANSFPRPFMKPTVKIVRAIKIHNRIFLVLAIINISLSTYLIIILQTYIFFQA